MRVVMVAPDDDGTNGIGSYATDLVKQIPNCTVDDHRFQPDTANPLHFVRKAAAIRRRRPDIVHVQHEYGLFGPVSLWSLLFFPILALTARLSESRVVVSVHESLAPSVLTNEAPPLAGLYVTMLNTVLDLTADNLVFLSTDAQQRFTAWTASSDRRHIPHGVATSDTVSYSQGEAKRHLGYDHEETLVVEPGYVLPRKGSHLLLEVARELPEAQFVLAGGCPDEDYKKQIHEARPSNVEVTGSLDDETFHAAFVAADVVALPYLEQETGYFVNKVSQSGIFNLCAAYRRPVVATDCAYFEQLEAEWGCLVTATPSPGSLADTVEAVLDDEDRRTRLANGLTMFEDANTMATVGKSYANLYTTLTATQ
ncbi:glycosyltransferase family 4 protein [Halomicrobium sp. IBSBa]|uniref:glycosyltransferase family 4 protein n=1 Tax=Halomicrobium sp. IBSBa TaxID=2778916 RepID=UPI001ABF0CB0|nr:glycosyltransferase family 4 protein [Halomicrobium sp. IBSBa]MBO4247091.1 glycosyltransferase family 4 protein [Halomicrobium sp. IBSBa]